MAIAASLSEAAGDAYDNLAVRWTTSTLKTTLTLFWQATIGIFPEDNITTHPVSNWITLIAALADTTSNTPPITDLTEAAQFVYRLCWMAATLANQGTVTTAQADALLIQYNLFIGF